jgi:hypothetical protein
MDIALDIEAAPEIFVQWYHAGPAELLSSAPVALGSTIAWQTLTREESKACEAVWRSMTPEEQQTAHRYIEEELEVPPGDEYEDDFLGVSVTLDKLFEVNVRTMRVSAHSSANHAGSQSHSGVPRVGKILTESL